MYTEKGNRGQGEELHQFQKPLSLSQANEVATDTATKIFTGVLRLQKQTTEGIETIVVHSWGFTYSVPRRYLLALTDEKIIVRRGENIQMLSPAKIINTLIAMLSEGKESGKFAWLLVQSHPEILYTEPEKLYSIGKVLKEVGKLDWFSHKVLTDPTLLGFVYLARDSSDDLIDLITSREKPLSETERKGLSILQWYIWPKNTPLQNKVASILGVTQRHIWIQKQSPTISTRTVFGMPLGSFTQAFRRN